MPYSGFGTKKEIEQRQKANRTHGAYAFQHRGPAALDVENIAKLSELRELAQTHSGRLEIRRELAARAAMMSDLFFAYLLTETEKNTPVVNSKAQKYLGYWIALANRVLADIPNEDELGDSAAQIIEAMNDNAP